MSPAMVTRPVDRMIRGSEPVAVRVVPAGRVKLLQLYSPDVSDTDETPEAGQSPSPPVPNSDRST